MFRYRITALLLPVLLLAFLPALAAYPWHLPLGDGLAFPFLTVLVMMVCALRYPGLLPSPVVFLSGLACDLFTRSPIGYWTLLMLVTLALCRLTVTLSEQYGRLLALFCYALMPVSITVLAHALASLYQFSWQPIRPLLEGMLMALILLMAPLMLLLGLETVLITKKDDLPSPRRFRTGRY